MNTLTHISVPVNKRFSYVNTALTSAEDLRAFSIACGRAIKADCPALSRQEIAELIASALTSKFVDLEDLLNIEYI